MSRWTPLHHHWIVTVSGCYLVHLVQAIKYLTREQPDVFPVDGSTSLVIFTAFGGAPRFQLSPCAVGVDTEPERSFDGLKGAPVSNQDSVM